ncbi:MAG TPA: hypothetical protein VJZ27_17755, partial [Aggregatilineales bacterium]|nr:hypothetical protein [Aggregatilineales bacterium]
MMRTGWHNPPDRGSLWTGLAIVAGIAASLPFPMSIVIPGVVFMAVVFYLEPMLSLVFMLAVAPLKTLIETEASFPLPLDAGQLSLLL